MSYPAQGIQEHDPYYDPEPHYQDQDQNQYAERDQAAGSKPAKRERTPYEKHRRKLLIRRVLGVLVIVVAALGFYWALFHSPVAPMIDSIISPVAGVINNPLGVDWGGAFMKIAGIVLLKISLLAMIFDQN